MKEKLILFLLMLSSGLAGAQQIDAAYVKALYHKYPTQPTDFCSTCKL